MKNRKLTCLFISIFITLSQFKAQVYQKIIVDNTTKRTIDFVYITTNISNTNYISDENGVITFKKINNINVYKFYKLGYQTKLVKANDLIREDTIFLNRENYLLQEIEIVNKKIDTVIQNKKFYIDDYRVLENGDFLLVTSKINISGFEVVYYKKNKGITYNRKFSKESNPSFFKDCFQNYHLLTSESSRQIFLTSDSTFDFLPKYRRTEFDSTLANAVLKIDSEVIYRSPNKTQFLKSNNFALKINSTALNFYKVSKKNVTPFYHLEYEKALMNMIRNELNDWEILFRNRIVNKRYINNQLMYFEKIIAKPILAPIFKRNDTIIIFNLQDNYIQLLNKMGDSLSANPIVFEKRSKLKPLTILCDGFSNQFYISQSINDVPYIYKLNVLTGQVTNEIRVEKTFPKSIQIVGGKLYYLVKEKQWDDTSYLYSQNL